MANKIAPYDPIWYANLVLERLEKRLTFVGTFSRGFDDSAREKGSTIEYKRPGGFVAEDMPGTAQDLRPEADQIKLDNWKGVVFGLDDRELAYSGEEIIRHHVDPAVTAVASAIEASAVRLYKDIPFYVDAAGTAADFINARKVLNDNNVPYDGRFLALNHEREATYLGLDLFASSEKSAEGANTQREGYLGRKFGFGTFTAPMLGNHTPGALTGAPTLAGAHARGDKQVTMGAGALTGTIKKGDSFSIAGNAQRYVATSDATAAGNSVTVGIFPALVQDYAGNAAVTVRQQSKGINIGYHANAFALVMAPLSDAGNGRGAEIGISVDKQTGLAIRVTRWYDANDAKHKLRFDALWGVKTVDPNLAVRLEGPTT